MDIKGFFTSKSTLFVLKNILLAILIVVVLLTGLYFWLRHYTEHGVEIEVPNVVGMYYIPVDGFLQSFQAILCRSFLRISSNSD